MSAPADIFSAVAAGDAAAVQAALQADPAAAAARDAHGRTPLMLALYHHRQELASMLAAARSDLDVFEAAAIGNLDMLDRLLAAEPSAARAYSADGFTALHLAAFFDRSDAARRLLDCGADVAAAARNDMRVQPLHSAAAGGHEAICQLLLQHGADANARQQAGYAPLHSAAGQGSLALVNLLLHYGADADAHADDGRTPADMAQAQGHTMISARLRAEL